MRAGTRSTTPVAWPRSEQRRSCLLTDSLGPTFESVTGDGPPFPVPRYLHLDLGKQTQRNVARFRLHSHALRIETRSWEHHDGTCDKRGLQAIQDKKHALSLCSCMLKCSLRLQFADLFHHLPMAHKNNWQSDWSFLFLPSCSDDAFNFFQKQN